MSWIHNKNVKIQYNLPHTSFPFDTPPPAVMFAGFFICILPINSLYLPHSTKYMLTLDAAHEIMIEAGFTENYRRVLPPNVEYISYYWVDKRDRHKTSYHNQMYTINGELTPKSLEFLERVAAKLNKKKHG